MRKRDLILFSNYSPEESRTTRNLVRLESDIPLNPGWTNMVVSLTLNKLFVSASDLLGSTKSTERELATDEPIEKVREVLLDAMSEFPPLDALYVMRAAQ